VAAPGLANRVAAPKDRLCRCHTELNARSELKIRPPTNRSGGLFGNPGLTNGLTEPQHLFDVRFPDLDNCLTERESRCCCEKS
jgi:hypothetical protein